MMKKTVLFLLLCMAAAPGLSQTLTLDECRAAAEEHNRTLKTSRLDLDAALQARREAFTTYSRRSRPRAAYSRPSTGWCRPISRSRRWGHCPCRW